MQKNRIPIRSMILFKNSQGESVRGTLMKLTRTTLVLEVYNPYSIVQLSEVLNQLTIFRGQEVVYEGRAVVSNLVNTGLMLIVSTTLVDSWKDLSKLNSDEGIQGEVEYFINSWNSAQQLYSGYQLIVGKIRSFLYELNMWMEQIDLIGDDTDNSPTPDKESLEKLAEAVLPTLQELFATFEIESRKIPSNDLMMHKMHAQHDLHPLLMRSPFVHRTYTKPLGYAGDYEMVNMMMRDGWEGPTAYAKLVNYFHILAGPAQAHRNRIDVLYTRLQQLSDQAMRQAKKVKVLNIACGPALEVQKFIANTESADCCKFSLLDFNKSTLEYTRNELNSVQAESGRLVNIDYIHESVHKLLKKAHAKEIDLGESSYDFIYCAGLFDYLSDRVCSRLLKLFYRLAKPGSTVLVTNVDPSNESISLMEHILDWYLIYRDEAHLAELVKGMGCQKTYSDETGMNVFLEITKT